MAVEFQFQQWQLQQYLKNTISYYTIQKSLKKYYPDLEQHFLNQKIPNVSMFTLTFFLGQNAVDRVHVSLGGHVGMRHS